ncbi:MAG: DUF4340 domain-containing protein [Phycisphaerae bacterium]|nr:DUF4340 domain-containing protein [Phycisphaerae bacterium]
MNDLTKTIIAILVAAGLSGAVYLTRPAPVADARFSDQGQLLFPDFTDPTAAKGLQVLAYDEASAAIKPFKVEFDGTRWIIPSHHGYPADAQKNMAEAAAVFIGLEKEQFVTDLASEHQAYGVLAPDDAAAPLKGRGTRITLTGQGGAVLADLIVGKEVKTTTADPGAAVTNRRYVRLPDKSRVYAINFSKTFSTAFVDWVETDLLKLGSEPINTIVVDKYEVDEAQGIKNSTEKLTITRAATAPTDPMNPTAAAGGWMVDSKPGGPPIGGETVNATRIEEMVGALRSLKIAGVRPKPQRLADWFAGKTDKVTQMDVLDLQSKGFFTTQQGQFVGNQGEMSVACADGVVYSLYFGEVLFGEGDALSAGKDVIASSGGETGPQPDQKGQESRYAFVNARFDESLIPMPVAPAAPETPSATPPAADTSPDPLPAPGGAEQDSEPAEHSPASAPSADPAQVSYQNELAERSKKVEAGKKRAAQLASRFANWYYVVDASSFSKLRPSRGEVISKPVLPTSAAPPQTGTPTLPQ